MSRGNNSLGCRDDPLNGMSEFHTVSRVRRPSWVIFPPAYELACSRHGSEASS